MITLTIIDGPTFKVNWQSGMNAQQALEAAYNDASSHTFTYSLQYFGTRLGYLVNMINGTSESLDAQEVPFFYWEILYNDTIASTGIDSLILNDGDVVGFKFTEYDPAHPEQSTAHVKFRNRS